MEREKLGSRLGFILLSAGCAIGLGNVWKFPYITGQNGGAIFVLIYLLFLVILGLPVMTMEFALGRGSQKSPAKMYKELEPAGTKWHWHSYLAVAGNYLLMMFYTSVAGWLIKYFVDTATGKFEGLNNAGVEAAFGNMLANPIEMIIYMALVVIVGFLVCSFSLQKGLERITKWMMLALLAIMIVLAFNSIFLRGSGEGLKFYLLPSIENFKAAGPFNVIVAAMNQAFFTLSLGIGSMAIFGSYLKKDRSLMGEAINVGILDTFVALCSGLIIFPACSAFSVEVNAGPPLIFVTLPNVFNNMPLGRLWGSLFFVFLSFAALSTVFAVFENINAMIIDLTGISKKKASLINGVAMFLLSLPCVLGFNIWSAFQPLGAGKNIMDLEDFIVSNILLPVGSLVFVLFCTTKRGWGFKNFMNEANTGKGFKVKKWMSFYFSYILPVIIVILFVIGIYNFFK